MTEDAMEKFVAILEEVSKRKVDTITRDTDIESLPIDSLDLFSVIMALENETGVKLEDTDLQSMSQVGDFLDFFFPE